MTQVSDLSSHLQDWRKAIFLADLEHLSGFSTMCHQKETVPFQREGEKVGYSASSPRLLIRCKANCICEWFLAVLDGSGTPGQ
jgi:hypothetical protein